MIRVVPFAKSLLNSKKSASVKLLYSYLAYKSVYLMMEEEGDIEWCQMWTQAHLVKQYIPLKNIKKTDLSDSLHISRQHIHKVLNQMYDLDLLRNNNGEAEIYIEDGLFDNGFITLCNGEEYSDLNGELLILYSWLSDFAMYLIEKQGKSGRIRMCARTMGEKFGVSEDAMCKQLHFLKKKGLVERCKATPLDQYGYLVVKARN